LFPPAFALSNPTRWKKVLYLLILGPDVKSIKRLKPDYAKGVLHQLCLLGQFNKIPNLDTAELIAGKHQISNKSQITIFNDQNILVSGINSRSKLSTAT